MLEVGFLYTAHTHTDTQTHTHTQRHTDKNLNTRTYTHARAGGRQRWLADYEQADQGCEGPV
jgi:hypothetical protein